MTAFDEILYDLPVVELAPEGAEALESAEKNPQAAWYLRRRRMALATAGLLAAGKWNPLLHPRGPDGRFINKNGFVRWLFGSEWVRGQVTDILSNGTVKVRRDNGAHYEFTHIEARERLYSLPKPKATLTLPDPKMHADADGFKKVGGQGGSNPGGLYEVVDNNVKTKMNIPTESFELAAKSKGILFKPLEDNYVFTNGGVVLDKSTGTTYIVSAIDKGKLVNIENGDHFAIADLKDNDLWYVDVPASDKAVIVGLAYSTSGQAPTVGDKFYVKTGKSPEHARNEALANMLYEMGGVPVPDVSVGADGVTIASKIVSGDEVTDLLTGIKDPEILSKIRQDMVFDAWLANWDVVGLEYDNMIIVDGMPYRIDAGGALLYRAMGGAKGHLFGDDVGELETLRTKNIQGKVFGKITDAELKAGATRLAAITPDDIRMAVLDADMQPDLADRLIARRKSILDQLGVPDPVEWKADDEIEALIKQEQAIADEIAAKADVSPFEEVSADEWTTLKNVSILEEPAGPYVPLEPGKTYWNPVTKQADPGELFNSDDARTKLGQWLGYYYDETIQSDVNAILDAWDPNQGEPLYVADLHENAYEVIQRVDSDAWQMQHLATGEIIVSGSGGHMTLTGGIEASRLDYEDLYLKAYASTVNDRGNELTPTTLAEAIGDNTLDPWYPSGYSLWSGASYDSKSLMRPDGTGKWIAASHPDPSLPYTLYQVVEANDEGITAVDLSGNERKFTPAEFEIYDVRVGSSIAQDIGDMLKYKLSAPKPSDPVQPWQKNGDPLANVPLTEDPVPETPTIPFNAGTVSIDGLSSKLPAAGPFVSFDELTPDEWNELVGKTVVITVPDNIHDNAKWNAVWRVHEIKTKADGSLDRVTFYDSTGSMSTMWSPVLMGKAKVTQVDYVPEPVDQFTLKQNSDIVVNGVVVGKWAKTGYYHWDTKYKYELDPEYTISGGTVSYSVYKKNEIAGAVLKRIIVPAKPVVVKKSDKAKNLEKAVKDAAAAPTVGDVQTISDGTEAKVGLLVISVKDGSTGKILKTNKDNYALVEMSDGAKKWRALSKLKVAEAKPVEVKPGMTVKHEMTGEDVFVVSVADGLAKVKPPDGTSVWVAVNKLKPIDSTPDGVSPAAAATAKATAGTKKAGTVTKAGTYAMPDGTTITQSEKTKKAFFYKYPDRKTTKDGFIPVPGMAVRDKSGTKLTVLRIGNTLSSKNSVWVVDEKGTIKSRTVSTLLVDHQAELTDADGKPLPKFGKLHFKQYNAWNDFSPPVGSTIYKTVQTNSGNEVYWFVSPTGDVGQVGYYSSNSKKLYNHFNSWQGKDAVLVRVGVFAEDGDMELSISTGHKDKMAVIHPKGQLEKTLKEKAAKEAAEEAKKIAEDPFYNAKFSGDVSNNALPKPADAPSRVDKETGPTPPSIEGSATSLTEAAVIPGARSVSQAVTDLIATQGQGGRATGLKYALGDSDLIEDMLVRSQVALDEATGEKYVEVRFNLLENPTDDLARKIMTASGQEYGGWSPKSTGPVMASDIVDGDYVNVRKNWDGRLGLEWGGAYAPNARVVGQPTLIGKDPLTGVDSYRVNVAIGTQTASIVVEQGKGFDVFAWDPDRVVKSSGDIKLAPNAAAMGWQKVTNRIGYAIGKDRVSVDDEGLHRFDSSNPGQIVLGDGSGAAVTGGRFQLKDDATGAHLDINLVYPQQERSKSKANGEPRRATPNGDVVIRVPLGDGTEIDRVPEAVSRLMSAVGVPPDKQGQPSPEQIRAFAANKISKQYSRKYEHMRTANGMDSAVSAINDALGDTLDSPATENDILIRVLDDGRFQVVVSDRIAEAAVKKSGIHLAYHGYSGSEKTTMSALDGAATYGLVAADERFSVGMARGGKSVASDALNDAGNRVYLRYMSKGKKTVGNHGSTGIVVVPMRAVMKTTDFYWHENDAFGSRGSDNLKWLEKAFGYGAFNDSGQELMMKRRVDPEMFGWMLVAPDTRKKVLAKLKERGVTHVGPRPIESVIIDASAGGELSLDDLPVFNPGNEIPLPQVVGALA